MSVFGGDSWAREAQHRKRRLDDLLLQNLNGSSFNKLSSGKFQCLVCPHNPVIDSPLILSMHCKGSRHLAAESRLKERELSREAELNKRISFSNTIGSPSDSNCINKKVRLANKPLIEQTRKAASEVLCCKSSEQNSKSQNSVMKLGEEQLPISMAIANPPVEACDRPLIQQPPIDFRARRERELKFIQAGWKRDCHGRWYKDENAEFDSDEEDPNG